MWNPPLPLLFQWSSAGQNRPVSAGTIRKALGETLAASGLTNAAGAPLDYQPHDFRRIFVTDAILSGLPPHIAQIICGHKSITTTMGYKATYPTEAIEAHRGFIARRRALRPGEEYRTPTSEEWDAFLGHFERRDSPSESAPGRSAHPASMNTPASAAHSCDRTRPSAPGWRKSPATSAPAS